MRGGSYGEPWPDGVEVVDYGIRGVHLAFALLEGYDLAILIDALPHGAAPGTVVVMEPQVAGAVAERAALTGTADAPLVDAHTMDPVTVLAMLHNMGGAIERVIVVGCEPADIGDGMGLTPAVEAAIPAAMQAVRDLVADLLVPATTKGGTTP